MSEEMEHSQAIDKIMPAYVKAWGATEGAKKDTENPHFKRKYADLESVMDACKSALSENSLAVAQSIRGDFMITRLWHSSGQWLEGSTPLLIGKQDMQGLGSAMTYARRYGLMAIIGIAPEDDDGNAAVATGPAQQQKSIPHHNSRTDEPTDEEAAFLISLLDTLPKIPNMKELHGFWADNWLEIDKLPVAQKKQATDAKDIRKDELAAPPETPFDSDPS